MDADRLEERARDAISEMAYHYIAGGADDELTLAANRAAWGAIELLPHVLRDVSGVDASTRVLATTMSAPIVVAPMATHRLVHPDGELATSAGAVTTGIPLTLSSMATVSIEDVAAADPGAGRWFQLYVHRDRRLTAELIERAGAAGYEALVLTVDLPVLGRRRRDEQHRLGLPHGITLANLGRRYEADDASGLAHDVIEHFDPTLTFETVEWVAEQTDLPVLVKGIVRADDAVAALDAGAAGVIVSNHGGRQLDRTVATARALPAVVAAVAGRAPVLVDGGIRSGTDVVTALAMGAVAVMVGRPVLWALGVGGADDVAALLTELTDETVRSMALMGAADVTQLGPDLLFR